VREEGFVADTRDRVRRERTRLREGLEALGLGVRPSEAPFLLVDCGGRDVDEILADAREHGVVLRDARTFRGLDSHVRVAVRNREATDRTLATLEAVLDG
jgi:histidinol-phosphate/aromatic aminotransferase/cobyric acid decarboxylase-like protein